MQEPTPIEGGAPQGGQCWEPPQLPLLPFLLSHSFLDSLVIHDWSMCCWTQVGCFYPKHFSEKTSALNDLWLRALWVWVSLWAFLCLDVSACMLTGKFAAFCVMKHLKCSLRKDCSWYEKYNAARGITMRSSLYLKFVASTLKVQRSNKGLGEKEWNVWSSPRFNSRPWGKPREFSLGIIIGPSLRFAVNVHCT